MSSREYSTKMREPKVSRARRARLNLEADLAAAAAEEERLHPRPVMRKVTHYLDGRLWVTFSPVASNGQSA